MTTTTAYDPIFLAPKLGSNLSVNNLTTTDLTPPITGTCAEVGVTVSVVIRDQAGSKISPAVAASHDVIVQADNTWTVADGVLEDILTETEYVIHASATVFGEAVTATGVLRTFTTVTGTYGHEYAIEYE
jgi:hypothetical protein